MSELVQVYIRLKPYSVNKSELDRLGHRTEEIVRGAAIESYGGPVEIDVLLESGTLRTTLTVIGSILVGGYYAVGNYKSFKEGVVEIVEDGKKFSVLASDAFVAATKAYRHQVELKATRQKTPGKLKRVLNDLERLDEAAAQTGGRYSQVGLSRVSYRLKQVMKELDEDEAAALGKVLKFKNLPPLENWPDPVLILPEPDPLGLKPDGDDLELGATVEAPIEPVKRNRLRYHSRVMVGGSGEMSPDGHLGARAPEQGS